MYTHKAIRFKTLGSAHYSSETYGMRSRSHVLMLLISKGAGYLLASHNTDSALFRFCRKHNICGFTAYVAVNARHGKRDNRWFHFRDRLQIGITRNANAIPLP